MTAENREKLIKELIAEATKQQEWFDKVMSEIQSHCQINKNKENKKEEKNV